MAIRYRFQREVGLDAAQRGQAQLPEYSNTGGEQLAKHHKLLKEIALTERKKHLDAVVQDYDVRTAELYSRELDKFSQIKGKNAFKDPNKLEKEAAKITSETDKKFEEMLAPLREEERKLVRRRVAGRGVDFDRGVYGHIAKEKAAYEKISFDKSVAMHANDSQAKFDEMVAVPGQKFKLKGWVVADREATAEIGERGKNMGYPKDWIEARELAYFNTAVPLRVQKLLNDDRPEAAQEHLEHMKDRISPQVYAQYTQKTKINKDLLMGQEGAAKAQSLFPHDYRRQREWLRKNLSGEAERHGISVLSSDFNANKAAVDHQRAESSRAFLSEVDIARKLQAAGRTKEANELFMRAMKKYALGVDAKTRETAEKIWRGHTQVTDILKKKALEAQLELDPESVGNSIIIDGFIRGDLSPKDTGELLAKRAEYAAGKTPAIGGAAVDAIKSALGRKFGSKKKGKDYYRWAAELTDWLKDFQRQHKRQPTRAELDEQVKAMEESVDLPNLLDAVPGLRWLGNKFLGGSGEFRALTRQELIAVTQEKDWWERIGPRNQSRIEMIYQKHFGHRSYDHKTKERLLKKIFINLIRIQKGMNP